MKKIKFMDVSFRDGFQSVFGARVKTDDFIPALEAAVEAGTDYFEIGGGARFQSLFFYCQENAFDMMDRCRQAVGPDINLQTLARGVNVVGLSSQSRDIINLHAKMFKKHGVTTIRNFDALNDVRNLDYSGRCIVDNGLKHEISVALMGLPPGMKDEYPHSPEFYIDRVKDILDAGIPFDSIVFKDASGTATPAVVYETIKKTRKLLGKDAVIHFHTHCTAGMGVSCNMAAIEGGADIIDLGMQPVSGGTGAVDILSMWHRLRNTEYTLDIDYEKYLTAEEVFMKQMEHYFMPPEAKETSPLIVLSPMPGGALTANTQMMRDNNCLDLYPEVIKEMREVVARGGYGTSVTPVSQFYFQQAFANVMSMKSGKDMWSKITDGYGKMVLGYFGKTPTQPDEQIVKIAADQLGLEPTTDSVVDINDRDASLGIKPAEERLKKEGLEVTEENTFIVATCADKGVAFLKGDAPLGIRYKEDEAQAAAPQPAPQPAAAQSNTAANDPGVYTVKVNGQSYTVEVATGTGEVSSVTPAAAPAQSADTTPAPAGAGAEITAPMPGTVISIAKNVGDGVNEGEVIMVIEAMKMEVEIKATAGGTIASITVQQGDTLTSGQHIATIG